MCWRLNTSLHHASKDGDLKWVQLLLKWGIRVDVKNNYGETPLHLAVENSHENVVLLLLEARASVDIQDYYGRTPLHMAVDTDNVNVVNSLLKAGASVHIQDYQGSTALHYTCDPEPVLPWYYPRFRQKIMKVAKLLLNERASPMVKDKRGLTPLILAGNRQNDEMEQLLFSYGAKYIISNNNPTAANHYMCLYGAKNCKYEDPNPCEYKQINKKLSVVQENDDRYAAGRKTGFLQDYVDAAMVTGQLWVFRLIFPI